MRLLAGIVLVVVLIAVVSIQCGDGAEASGGVGTAKTAPTNKSAAVKTAPTNKPAAVKTAAKKVAVGAGKTIYFKAAAAPSKAYTAPKKPAAAAPKSAAAAPKSAAAVPKLAAAAPKSAPPKSGPSKTATVKATAA